MVTEAAVVTVATTVTIVTEEKMATILRKLLTVLSRVTLVTP
jgi:hypothetical protein